MKPSAWKRSYRVPCAVIAAAFALAACGEKPPEKVNKAIELPIDKAALQAQQTASEEKKKSDEAKKAVDEKTIADTVLADKVKAALTATRGLNALPMSVIASDGAVTLAGTADTEAERAKAGQVAAGVPGVRSVRNALQVVKGS
jgi:hyperosmotically inducible protein